MTLQNKWEINEFIKFVKESNKPIELCVEGDFDSQILTLFFLENNLSEDLFDIHTANDFIVFPENNILSLNCEKNNKNKLILLSNLIDTDASINDKMKCIIDKDFDQFIEEGIIKNQYLMYTDYTSMDLYMLKSIIIKKLFISKNCHVGINFEHLTTQLYIILKELYFFRFAFHKLNLGSVHFLDYKKIKELKIESNTIKFDVMKFIDDFIKAKKLNTRKTEIKDTIKNIRNLSQKDPRECIYDEDFLKILYYIFIKEYKKSLRIRKKKERITHLDDFKSLLISNLSNEILIQEKLFQSIIEWINTRKTQS